MTTKRQAKFSRRIDHTRRVAVIEITRHDWPHTQAVCFRPMPTLKPTWFTRTIRAFNADKYSAVRTLPLHGIHQH